MLNKLRKLIREYEMVAPGDTVICAVSGGADSVAMLFAFYLLKEKLGITLEAAHFDHRLRGEESQRDAEFVKSFCDRYDIPLHLGSGTIVPGKKGLEAAAREARYGFLNALPGKIATAHTADDNAETLLMHLIRGTGLKGLGGITPVRGKLIRPMLLVTRAEVEDFLDEWCLSHVEDSSNASDAFLRNRVRHNIMPLLYGENPRLGENLSRTAMTLREEEEFLYSQANFSTLPTVESLKTMTKALRRRCLAEFLRRSGVKEPEERHIAQAEALVFSEKPSARGEFPGGVVVERRYDMLCVADDGIQGGSIVLPVGGAAEWNGWLVTAREAEGLENDAFAMTVAPEGEITLGSRMAGDTIRLSGGSKSLKKLFIDRKIPAAQRGCIPVVRDGKGVLAVGGIGGNLERRAEGLPAVTIRFEKQKT